MSSSTTNSESPANRLWIWVVCLAVLAGAAYTFLNYQKHREPAENTTEEREDVLPEVRAVSNADVRPTTKLAGGFSSSDSCVKCHEHEHSTWHSSYHRTMTQVVTPETAPDVIRDSTVTFGRDSYQFKQEGDKFFVTFRDPLADGKTLKRELVMMTGSHHVHMFWYATDFEGTPGELSVVYLIEEKKWVPRLSSFLRPPGPEQREIGTWNRICSKCHATHARERYQGDDTLTWDTQVVEFGIACEACHGEGKEHAERYANQENGASDTAAAAKKDQIVNPAAVSKQISADICGSCHSKMLPNFEAVGEENYMADGNPFRPGQLLSECSFIDVIQASPGHLDSDAFKKWSSMQSPNGSFWSDGMVRVAGREYNGLIESTCYLKGDMSCLSCHTMHPSEDQPLDEWRDDQLKPGMRTNQACLQCHSEYKDDIQAHTHHAPDSHGSQCMNCHMPYTTYGLLKTIRSHQISSPSVQATLQTDRPDACNLCHLDQTFAWTSKHLHDWYDQPTVKIDEKSDIATTATSLIHLLKGDAGQRAIQAAAFAWEPAREASGTDWMEPFLLFGLNDPYDAVRLISARTLGTLPNRRSKTVDPLASEKVRLEAFNEAIADFDENVKLEPKPEVLIGADGKVDFNRAGNLLGRRNHSEITVTE